MGKLKDISVPAHLQELLQTTPSGIAKLIAAWDGLTPENQILILKARLSWPGYLHHRFTEKAIESENAFVRYLAAKNCYLSDNDKEEKALKKKIEKDPDPLVQYAQLESKVAFLDSDLMEPDRFFALPHEARLAKVRDLTGAGNDIANLIAHAVEHEHGQFV